MKLTWIAGLALVVGPAWLHSGCDGGDPAVANANRKTVNATAPQRSRRSDRIQPLRQLEATARSSTDFAVVQPWAASSGSNPFALLRSSETETLGLLRGADALVVLDERGQTLQRLAAPPRPTGLAPTRDGGVWVVGEGSGRVAHFERTEQGWVQDRAFAVAGVDSLRDVAEDEAGRLLLADAHRGTILRVEVPASSAREVSAGTLTICRGALSIDTVGEHALANCMLDHRVVVLSHEGDTDPLAIEHDGPIWSVHALQRDDTLYVAVGGVEDHPLDRTNGFGFVDSFAWVYRIGEASAPERTFELNVAEHGVVTPKAVALESTEDGVILQVTGYGSDTMLSVALDDDLQPRGQIQTRALAPGLTSFVGDLREGLAASPLLDAWVRWDADGWEAIVVPTDDDARGMRERLGEALLFTTLMAPFNTSEGMSSRFTCETCHFEGTVDGRTHYTGRQDVHATTKTLRGLFENRPHFSRALDRTMARMVHAEFRVANKSSGRDGWFTLRRGDRGWPDWLDDLGVQGDALDPIELRSAVMVFLMGFSPDLNPATIGREGFDAPQRRGAELFAEHCEDCHQARRVTDDPSTRVPFPEWESAIFGLGTIVWARAQRYRTGVQPYVHEEGARVPSLRRLYTKYPYFTNGTAPSIDVVLQQVRLGDERVHAGGSGRVLTSDERAALATFLDLL